MTDEARTGRQVSALAEAVRDDLGDIAADMAALRAKIETLGDAARAINGLGGACAGCADHVATLIAEVKKEQAEVPAKLLGQPLREIVATVNEEHAARVKLAREAA